ncbi:MAG: chromosomal replication initiator protein DnaA [Elusimicrobiota bacterium]|nr:chromosomal replication initiator protein DnaA [Elusimicrobiota bacterium]
MNKEELWQALLAQIQFNISPANFATWFKNTKISKKKGKEIVISVPNNFSKEWLENKYNKFILKTIKSLDKDVKLIKYEVSKSAPSIKINHSNDKKEKDQLKFEKFKTNKETNLNPRYTFENFVVGSFNELSHAAAQSICKKPGFNYNPFFIYGGVGLGKTHLIQAIGNEIKNRYPRKKIKYLSSEKFTSDVVNSIKNKSISKLKSEYKSYSLLIIDDIQFIAGKEKTQEEFFHIFNALYAENKQIVISSDRPPNAISSLEERLISRFEGGMITDISIPDIETRLAILRVKLQEKRADVGPNILEYIASNIKNNIRELEGALNQVIIYQKLNNCFIDEEKVKILLKKMVSPPYKKINSKKIIKIVSDFYGLKEGDLLCSSRKKEVVGPRQMAMYLLRKELKGSFPFIGRKFGGRDHTTAIYAVNKISKQIEEREDIKEELESIKKSIYKT